MMNNERTFNIYNNINNFGVHIFAPLQKQIDPQKMGKIQS